MRPRFLPAFAAVAVTACSSASGPGSAGGDQADAAGPVAVPDSLSPTVPRAAVDHVVTYASFRGWGPRDGDRATLVRHGDLVRLETRLIATLRPDERAVELSFANMATGASMSVRRDDAGALAGVSLRQGQREADLPAYRRRQVTRTGETERILGESCSVWRAEPEQDGPIHTACIAADGVVLRDTVLYRDSRVMSERRALSVQRRPVALAEVLPPREALDWDRWLSPSAAPQRENYVLTLTGQSGRGDALRRRFRADGVAKMEEQQTGDSIDLIGVTAPGVALTYHGRQPLLSISRLPRPPDEGPVASFESAPMSERAPLRLLGDSCRWFDAAVNVSDYGRIECRTADQLPLVIEEYSRGSRQGHWEAVSLVRGRLHAGSVRPPAELMSWRRWGWPMLEGGWSGGGPPAARPDRTARRQLPAG
jgi:hypothetical protein